MASVLPEECQPVPTGTLPGGESAYRENDRKSLANGHFADLDMAQIALFAIVRGWRYQVPRGKWLMRTVAAQVRRRPSLCKTRPSTLLNGNGC